jgi:hypothetical protein
MNSVISHTTSSTTIQQSFSLPCCLISLTETMESAILSDEYYLEVANTVGPVRCDFCAYIGTHLFGCRKRLARRSTEAFTGEWVRRKSRWLRLPRRVHLISNARSQILASSFGGYGDGEGKLARTALDAIEVGNDQPVHCQSMARYM